MFLRTMITAAALAAAVAAPAVEAMACNGYSRAERGNGRHFRVAEDIRLPVGNGGTYRIQSMQAFVATNLSQGINNPGFEVWFEVYRSAVGGGPGTRILSMKASAVSGGPHPIDLTIGGVPHRQYHASLTLPSNVVLEARPGETLWVSAHVFGPFVNGRSAFVLVGPDRLHSPASMRHQLSPGGPWQVLSETACESRIQAGFRQFCPADFNKSGIVDQTDLTLFMNAYIARSRSADFNRDGVVNATDLSLFIAACQTPCSTGISTLPADPPITF